MHFTVSDTTIIIIADFINYDIKRYNDSAKKADLKWQTARYTGSGSSCKWHDFDYKQ